MQKNDLKRNLKKTSQKVLQKTRKHIWKILIGSTIATTFSMCRMTPQETQEFKENYTELRSQENKAAKRTCQRNIFHHWKEEYNTYLTEKGLVLDKPFREENWSKNRKFTASVILDKDGNEVGWLQTLAKRSNGPMISIEMYVFSDKYGNSDLINFCKNADTSEPYMILAVRKGEKIPDALNRNSELNLMKMFHPFLSKQCEKDMSR